MQPDRATGILPLLAALEILLYPRSAQVSANEKLLANGQLDVVCEANLKLHDYAALIPVVEGAGGTMCDWNGELLHAGSEGHVIALGDPARMEDVVEALACNH